MASERATTSSPGLVIGRETPQGCRLYWFGAFFGRVYPNPHVEGRWVGQFRASTASASQHLWDVKDKYAQAASTLAAWAKAEGLDLLASRYDGDNTQQG